jgi:hypothetical protein
MLTVKAQDLLLMTPARIGNVLKTSLSPILVATKRASSGLKVVYSLMYMSGSYIPLSSNVGVTIPSVDCYGSRVILARGRQCYYAELLTRCGK